MGSANQAVFLSYASQDADLARGICDALRAAGVEVWFDQSELRGGDAWDAMIRRQIKECALFVPIISAATESRTEGYFRLEWKLAVDRSHLMSEDQPFLLPIAIDGNSDSHARVPERFREVQWVRLVPGQSTSALVQRVRRLLSDSPALAGAPALHAPPILAAAAGHPARGRLPWVLAAGALMLAAAGFAILQGRAPAPGALVAAATSTVFTPPPHSLAVLPFVNMSGDPKQDYFSDGLSEELLNSLVTIRDLQVAARTSSFSFKGKDTDIADIARKLNVGAVLEGSVRKDGSHVRITAQLINTVTGFHLWSQTYDRDMKSVLALQTDIATAVTRALQATLLSNAAATIELGGTQNPQAFDAYLRGERLYGQLDRAAVLAQIEAYGVATRLDPNYAKAYAGKARALQNYWGYLATTAETPEYGRRALAAAEKAVALAPDLGRAHSILADHLFWTYQFPQALSETERALALAPGDAVVLINAGIRLAHLGSEEKGLQQVQRAITLDPLNAHAHAALGRVYFSSRQFQLAIGAYERAIALDPKLGNVTAFIGQAQFHLDEFDAAIRSCSTPPLTVNNHVCLAIAYHRLGQPAKVAEEIATITRENGDAAAAQFAEIYTQIGDRAQALDWLEKAYRLHDPGLAMMRGFVGLDALRDEPRFQAVLKRMNFPG
jgi:TolB-like protein/Tfp pilus assembly protein PilF